jgi:uncharacterized membrane protein YagU involved in acid resistance
VERKAVKHDKSHMKQLGVNMKRMKLKFYYYYSQVIYHLCLTVHKLYSILERKHSRMCFKIREELK